MRDYQQVPDKPEINYQAAAIWFAERGYRVYPLQPRLGTWALGDWQRNATTHIGTVRVWWAYGKPQQNCGIGIVGLEACWGIDGDRHVIAEVTRGEHRMWWYDNPTSWVIAPPTVIDRDKTKFVHWYGRPK